MQRGKNCKLGQTGLVHGFDQSSSVGMCVQDYKSLSTAVMICASLVNTQTHSDKQLLISYMSAS